MSVNLEEGLRSGVRALVQSLSEEQVHSLLG